MDVLGLATLGARNSDEMFQRFLVDVHGPGGEERLTEQLAGSGIATFDDVRDVPALLRLCRSIGEVLPHRDSDVHGVTTLAGPDALRAAEGSYLGFGSGALYPHTEGTGVAHPPPVAVLACQAPARAGGATLVADGRAIYGRLRGSTPELLRALGRPGSAAFGEESAYRGAIFETALDGAGRFRFNIRFRRDGLARFDDSARAALPALLDLIDELTQTFTLRAGQAYAVQNGRWLHGRASFEGSRVVHRVLIKPYDRPLRGSRSIGWGFTPP